MYGHIDNILDVLEKYFCLCQIAVLIYNNYLFFIFNFCATLNFYRIGKINRGVEKSDLSKSYFTLTWSIVLLLRLHTWRGVSVRFGYMRVVVSRADDLVVSWRADCSIEVTVSWFEMSNISWNPTEHTVMSTLQRISCFMGVKTISYFALRRFALGSLPTANYDDVIT